ncbi:hypothetical protein DFH06DRAFT_1222669 [Mycena polygramma]|nr:hypothetical protein DFH06DRAFT_1222669 [Mycena polygramma]
MIRCGTRSLTMSQEAVLDELFTALSQTRQSNCVLVAAVTFLAFDICISFDQEAMLPVTNLHLSRERWSLPKVLYLFCRYYGLVDLLYLATHEGVSVKYFNPHTLSCHIYYGVYDSGPVMLATTVDILFILRIHALYNRSLKMLACLILLFFGYILVITVKEAVTTAQNAFEPPQGVHWPGCVTIVSTFPALVGWVPAIFVSLIFFILTMVKFVIVFRTSHSEWRLGKLRELKSYSPILMAFVRDGTVFFLLYASVPTVLVNTVTDQVFKGPLSGIVLPWVTAIYSFSASRLVLNIRSISARDDQTAVAESFSMHFRTPGDQPSSVETDAGET